MAEVRRNLIQAESVDSFLREIQESSPVDEYTFYAHDILAKAMVDSIKVDGVLYAVGRKVSESVAIDGGNYMATLLEEGVAIRDGELYHNIELSREPLTRPQRGRYTVDYASWHVRGPAHERVGSRSDHVNWRGRNVEGKLHTVSYTDALTKTPWVKQVLLELRKNSRGGFNG